MFKKLALIMLSAVSIGFGSLASGQELVQNGDFSNNTFGATQFNLGNATVTANIANCTGFGTAEEIDLIYNNDFGGQPPVGNSRLGLHFQGGGNSDAFSLALVSNVSAGQVLRLRFLIGSVGGGNTFLGGQAGTLQIGISNVPNAFGTQIYQVAAPGAGWTAVDTSVVAPTSGGYITVRATSGFSVITNISLMASTRIVSMSSLPREIRDGQRAEITVNLDRPAPAGGAQVNLTYSAPALIAPSSVIVPGGSRTVKFFVIGKNKAPVDRRVDITGRLGNSLATTWVLVRH